MHSERWLSLAELAVQLASRGNSVASRMADTWKLLAFLGRYTHQPVSAMMDMPMVDLVSLAKATGELIEEESAETRRGTDID